MIKQGVNRAKRPAAFRQFPAHTITAPLTSGPWVWGSALPLEVFGSGITYTADGMLVPRQSPPAIAWIPMPAININPISNWWFGYTIKTGFASDATWPNVAVDFLNIATPNPLGARVWVDNSKGWVQTYVGANPGPGDWRVGILGATNEVSITSDAFAVGATVKIAVFNRINTVVAGKAMTTRLHVKVDSNATKALSAHNTVEDVFQNNWNPSEGHIALNCSPAFNNLDGGWDSASDSYLRHFIFQQGPADSAKLDAYIADPASFMEGGVA